ncbi:glutathione S-transferase family protein [Phenylobacterium sp.]|jgi:glutathione S-transferase|uniref:glutathione S-transferase family protein n=1 Tax=Phenylobacterium sp. TaxID=1871053 RepID=UPI002E330CE2|nr:glutathione S-transferase family protein [Phenylobacterium sp.]HEX2559157.1 glutathione S-transferase family protein [Phenylobacterium sp.]
MLIYGDLVSGNCLKVKWTADYLGRSYEWVDVDVLQNATRTPEFLAVNPAGQVPTVVLDDGRPLAQSNAIILHLAEGSDLIPADPYQRAKMLEWMFWEQYSHEPYIAVARFHARYLRKPLAELDEKLVVRGNAALKLMDEALEGGEFLAGPLSLADVALVAYTRWAHEGGFDLSRYPNVQAWIGRVEAGLRIAD